MTIFHRVSTSPGKKLKASESTNHSQKPPNSLLLGIAFICGGVILTTNVAIRSGYNVMTSAEVTPGKVVWTFDGKPALPPSQQP